MEPQIYTEKLKPLFAELGSQPLRYCLPLYFTDNTNCVVDNGTITLLDSGNDNVIGVTCLHCIDSYNKQMSEGRHLSFYVGGFQFNPNDYIIDKNERYDLVTFKFNTHLLPFIKTGFNHNCGSLLVKDIYREELIAGQFITLAGFPGSWRYQRTEHHLTFLTGALGPCEITTAGPDWFSCRMEGINNWVKARDNNGKKLTSAGGFSGGPVFAETKTQIGIWHQQFAGIITEGLYIEEDDILKISITPARLIHLDGSIDSL